MSDGREAFAAEFGTTIDPNRDYSAGYDRVAEDPIELFMDSKRDSGISAATVASYDSTFNQYREYMAERGRHPAAPSEDHIGGFIEWCRSDLDNSDSTIESKLVHLNAFYKFLIEDSAFPNEVGYNPVQLAWDRMENRDEELDEHRTTREELREAVGRVRNIRDRAYVVLGLKLGMRAGEICNIRFEDVNLRTPEIRDHYDGLGSDPRVAERPNSIVIPCERDGNKSLKDRVMPLDEETRYVLKQWLMIRPDCGTPWVFVGKTHHRQMDPDALLPAWKKAFPRPEYGERDGFDAVGTHYGRHRFTTFWKVEKEIERNKVKYMRGDKRNEKVNGDNRADAIDSYIHVYYEDIEQLYRNGIYRLRVT